MTENVKLKDASIVIGFRDWGLLRLKLAVESIKNSVGRYDVEIIISDYGSADPKSNRELADELGIGYVFTPRTGPWSRSRALNAGFAISTGKLLVSTDADMIFSPQSFERIIDFSLINRNSALFLQCRDLPSEMDENFVAEHPEAWDLFESKSQLRPRWGMGGMMAIPREGFMIIRGFDERLHTYGGEDLDFAQRARRAGYKTQWLDDDDIRMFHVWHPPTSAAVAKDPEQSAAVEANREIVYKDKTYVRNYLHWAHRPSDAPVLVTVAIATQNRADMISDTIYSILAQTVQDFEIVVIDDGGEDNLRDVLDGFNDPRIRYFWQEAQGISAARNFALEKSLGYFTAVIDDDDLMHPKRLEWHLDSMEPGLSGNVGSFANFDNETGELALMMSKKPIIETAIENGTSPGHGTWFIKTDVLRSFRYDESITSGVDHNIYIRMLRSGISLAHTGKPVTLRRMHPRQVSVVDRGNQRGAASFSTRFLQSGTTGYSLKKLKEELDRIGAFPKGMDREAFKTELTPYLPDSLIVRDLLLQESKSFVAEFDADGLMDGSMISIDGVTIASRAVVLGASYSDMANLRSQGVSFEAVVSDGSKELALEATNWMASIEDWLIDHTEAGSQSWFAYAPNQSGSDALDGTHSVRVNNDGKVESWFVLGSDSTDAIQNFVNAYAGAFVRGTKVFGGQHAV
ncbi:glycosyltransferase [Corynebacterium sp. L4756]|uniref:glycosyltransferase n=1 Tax=unclassified Corynebacterium TaxID=2624378 RepID=UPI00374CE5DB